MKLNKFAIFFQKICLLKLFRSFIWLFKIWIWIFDWNKNQNKFNIINKKKYNFYWSKFRYDLFGSLRSAAIYLVLWNHYHQWIGPSSSSSSSGWYLFAYQKANAMSTVWKACLQFRFTAIAFINESTHDSHNETFVSRVNFNSITIYIDINIDCAIVLAISRLA